MRERGIFPIDLPLEDLAAKSASILAGVGGYQHSQENFTDDCRSLSSPLLCQGLQFVLQRKARSAGPNLDPRVDLELSVGSCLRKISQVSFPSLLKFHKGAQSLVGPACFILKGYHPADHDEHEAEELGIVTSCLSFVKSCSRMKHSCHQSDLAASW